VLEATLQIGKLEGTWALFFDRREKPTDEQVAAILKIWALIAARLPVTTIIDRLLAELGPIRGELTAEQRDYLATITGSASASLLAGLYADDSRGDFEAAVEDALRAAMAQGQAGVLALNAEKHGITVGDGEGAVLVRRRLPGDLRPARPLARPAADGGGVDSADRRRRRAGRRPRPRPADRGGRVPVGADHRDRGRAQG
jgi:hypothetical protein